MLEDYDYKIAPGYTIDDYKKLNLRVDSDENTWEGGGKLLIYLVQE